MNDVAGGKLPISGGARLIIDGENVPFGAYQAIYHKITKKTERISQIYRHAYEITPENLSELHRRLEQAIRQYQVAGKHNEISHSLFGGQSRQYSSFEKFGLADTSIASLTRSLSYQLNFLIILPPEIPEAEDIPQRYKISIILNSQDVPDEDDEDDQISKAIRIRHSRSISLDLEYSDYTVALALKSVVDQWVGALRTERRTRFQQWVVRNKYSFSYSLADIISLVPYFTALGFFMRTDDISVSSSMLVLVACFIFSKVSFILADFFWKIIQSGAELSLPTTRLLITSGDLARKSECDDRHIGKRSILAGGMGLLLGLALNISSNWLYDVIVQ